MKDQKYVACWYCDNIVDHPEQVGLLHLSFPRCFVLIPNSCDFAFADFDEFLKIARVNWLDPSDKGTPEEQRIVLELLYNFSVEQEELEENLAQERLGDEF